MLPSPRSYVRADGAVAPDHWLEPSAVWEVKCADLSLSPIYPAARGLVSEGPGAAPPGASSRGRGAGAWARLRFLGGRQEDLSLGFIWESVNGIESFFLLRRNSPGLKRKQ